MANIKKATNLLDLLDIGTADQVAIREPGGREFTYDTLRSQVNSIGKQLRSMGVKRTDRVAIVIPNSAETIITFLGVAAAATAAPLNPTYKPDEFKFYLEDTDAVAIITMAGESSTVHDVASDNTIHIELEVKPDNTVILSNDKSNGSSSDSYDPGSEDVALVLHTSGTTSRPKMVPLTHANLARSVDNIINTYNLVSEDIALCVMPLFHVHGLIASTLSTFASGGTVSVPPKFNVLNFLRITEQEKFTWYTAVPSIHQTLLARAKGRENAYRLPDLKFIRSCSSSLAPATMLGLEELFEVPVLEAYGMTEASHQMSSNPLPPGTRLPGSVGHGTGVDIAIMNDTGNLLDTLTRGEVVIKGSNVFSGYENNDEANSTSFTDGWFRTGDEGMLDQNGYLTLLGRIKEIINRSGEKISPREIDEILLSHPAVAEAVAFGIPHPTHGEEPSAAVVLSASADQKELISFCRDHLADFKCPRVIHVVDEIPRTATGKIQRRMVAEVISNKANK